MIQFYQWWANLKSNLATKSPIFSKKDLDLFYAKSQLKYQITPQMSSHFSQISNQNKWSLVKFYIQKF